MLNRAVALISCLVASISVSGLANAAVAPLTKLPEPVVFQKVHPSCSIPTPSTQFFYVDPINGSNSGNGSQARPWHTLAEVIAAGLISTMPSHYDNTTHTQINNNPNAPIKPGATIYLLSGNHGNVTIQGAYGTGAPLGYNNSAFITIAALPGQTPVLSQLKLLGGNKWAFRGLTIQSANTTGQYMTAFNNVYNDYWLVSFTGPHQNIIFDNNHLLSQPDVSQWSMQTWETNRASGVLDQGGAGVSCVAITNNAIQNVGFGIQTQASTDVLIESNTIDHFSDDGIDYGSDNLIMKGNTITNSIEDGDGFHRDGMQGQPYSETTNISNVVISYNTVIRMTDPNLPFPSDMQGIDEFDGIWRNVVVKHNVVITHASQGITYLGVHNIQLTDNILLPDEGLYVPCDNLQPAACWAQSIINDGNNFNFVPNMRVDIGKDGTPSSGITIANNIVSGLQIYIPVNDWTAKSNCVLTVQNKCLVGVPVNGNMQYYGAPGTYSGITITPGQPSTMFRTYDPVHMIYDLRPLR